MDELRAQVARALFDEGAVKFGAFRLKLHDEHPDAPLSPIYLRSAYSKPPGQAWSAERCHDGAYRQLDA